MTGDGDADADADADGDGDADGDADHVPCRESPAWEHVELDPTIGPWAVDVAADATGAVHVTWTDADSASLLYATDADGWATHLVDADADPQRGAIAIDAGGDAHIVYFAQEVRDLRHAWRTSADPADWQTETVDADGNTGWSPDLAFDDAGRAHVVHGSTELGLRYARFDGAWSFESIDPDADGSSGGRLALDADGNPHAVYRTWDGSEGGLRVASREAAGGWTIASLTPPSSVREHFAIAVGPADLLTVAAIDFDPGALVVLTRQAAQWTSEQIDPGSTSSPSLAIGADGVVHLAYYWWEGHDARYARRNAGGWELETIAAAGDVGAAIALTLGPDGEVIVAFGAFDTVGGEPLRVASRPATGDLGPSPTCAPDPAGD